MDATNAKRLVFLCSGGGGNLAFVHQAIASGLLQGATIVAVITDRACQANQFANKVGIPSHCIDFREQNQCTLLKLLDELKPDLIITTVHKIIGPAVVARHSNNLINLHYSVLPAFGGLIGARSVQAALEYGCKFTGVTVHLVDDSVDGGRPLAQGVIAIEGDESLDALMQVVFRLGCVALLSVITERIAASVHSNAPQAFSVLGHSCLLNGGQAIASALTADEDFWMRLRQMLNVAD